MLIRAIVRFYDKPRNRFTLLIGALFIEPILRKLKREIAVDEKRMNEKLKLLGRLELTKKLLIKWWEK